MTGARRGGFLALGALALSLACVLTVELALPGPAAEDAAALTGIRPAPRRVKLDSARAVIAATDRSDAWVATILARPLFSRDRRPSGQAATARADEALPRLTGIAVSPTGRSAIFAGTGGGKPVVVSEGGTLGSYTVKAIGPGGVRVVGPGGARTVSPAFDPTPRTAETAPAGYPGPQPFPGQPLPGQPQIPLLPGNPLTLPGRFQPPRPGFGNGAFRNPGQFQRALSDGNASG